MKLTFMGAGSTVFAKNVLGDTMLCPVFHDVDIALYDIDAVRLEESFLLITALNKSMNESRATVRKYLGVENRKEALRGADFVVNAIQVGLYDPCTIIDFEIPKKYGYKQTIADTMGIGGIMRGMRTIHVMKEFAKDIEEVCPNAWLLNYTNPMAMVSGYMQLHTGVKTVGLCHSVQACPGGILSGVDMLDKLDGCITKIAGINHMAWLLEIYDKDGNDLYPEIRRRAKEKNATQKHHDMVRFDYIEKFGYYCTESSEHNAEYNPFYLKAGRDDLIEKFNIPIDEYPRRCINQINSWAAQRDNLLAGGNVQHTRSGEYASRIMEAVVTNTPYKIGGNVLNRGSISNLPYNACVEVPCLVDNNGITPTMVGDLPLQLAAMNSSNIYPQMLTIEAAYTGKKETLYQAALMEPHTGAQLSTDEIVSLCDELIEAHTNAGYPIF
ncbi:MAG: alpha-glucosidase/alpha-galactosidase [Clostridia bacterium]|nr:alpha-glucosidase/alpha-galactosidase [Clostridia bacterium]MBQ3927914.1 alpha-glucosidase/alpha-galactosidase [Clostridia bacterium]